MLRLSELKPGALFRLTVCLALLQGHSIVSSEEADAGCSENHSSDFPSVPITAGQSPGPKGAELVARGDSGNVEGGCRISGMFAEEDGKATVLVVERTDEAVDEADEESAKVSECVGTRFKKCR